MTDDKVKALEQAWLDAEGQIELLQAERDKLSAEVERLSKSPWITEEGFRDTEDLLDMGRVGQSLMDAIASCVHKTPGYEHWSPADDPAEIVVDLLNGLADEQTARLDAEAKLTALVEALTKSNNALVALHNLASGAPSLQGREHISLGIQVSNAIEAGAQALAHHSVPPTTPTSAPTEGAQLRPRAELLAMIDKMVDAWIVVPDLRGHETYSLLSEAAERIRADTPTSAPVEDVGGLERIRPAYENLREHQQQLDTDGCMVGVSRQALDEVLAALSPSLIQPRGEERCPKCGGTHPGRYEGACSGPPTPSAPPPHKMQG